MWTKHYLTALNTKLNKKIKGILILNMYILFCQVRIWNRNKDKAEKLVQELIQLNTTAGSVYRAYDDVKNCAEDADVIVTATFADEPFLKLDYLRANVHINGKFLLKNTI